MESEKLALKAASVYPVKTYDYSRVDFSLGVKKKVVIGCPVEGHGYFEQTLDGHLLGKEGCPSCNKENRAMTTEEFITASSALKMISS